METGFIFLDEAVHGIRWDAKYATWDNFTGKPVRYDKIGKTFSYFFETNHRIL